MNNELRYKFHHQFTFDCLNLLDNHTPKNFVSSMEKAIDGLYDRCKTSISELTLGVVLDRVIYNSSERHQILSMLKVESNRVSFKNFKLKDLNFTIIKEAFLYLITEFFFVIGNLTAEQLTPLLHHTFSEITHESTGSI